MDANTIMKLAGQQAAASQQQAVDVSNVMQQQQDVMQQQADLQITNQAGQTPEMVRIAGIAELEMQNRTQAVAAAMGLSSDLQADLQVMLARDLMQNTLAARESAQKISQKESVGFLDNPLEYIFNQFTLQDDYTVYDGQVAAANMAQQSMAVLDQRVATAKQTAANIATKVTEKTIADQLQAAENEIAVKKLEYQNKILGNEASRLEKIYSLSRDQFQSYYNMYQISNAEESKAMQREQFARMLEQDNERRQAKKDAAALEAEILADIHLGEQRDFGQALTPAATVKMHFGKNTPIGQQLQARYEQGQRLRLGIPTQVAGTLTGRVDRFNTEPIMLTTDAQKEIVKIQQAAVAAAKEANKGAKPEVIEEAAKKIFQAKWESWNRVIDPRDQTNPLAQLPIAALSESKGLNETTSWKLFKAVKKDKMDSIFDAGEFHKFVSASVESGTVKIEDAVSALSLAGQQAKILNNENNKLGYLAGVTQQAYPVRITSRQPSAALMLGPVITAAGVSTGVAAVPAVIAGGAMTAYGFASENTQVLDISKPEEARKAILLGLPTVMNTSGKKAADSQNFYPDIFTKKGTTQ